MYATDDNVWVAVELFIPEVNDYRGVFQRSITEIEGAIDIFLAEM